MTHQITMDEVQSSRIHSIGFDAETGTLAVRFRRKDGPGTLYHYSGVSQEEFDEFKGAESLGAHHAKVFKADAEKYPYTRIEEEEKE